MRQEQYHTCAKDAVEELFRQNPDRQFSTEQVISMLKNMLPEDKMPGKSTVYRIVARLCGDGALVRFRGGDGGGLYQYMGEDCDCGNHFHLKCSVCGRVYHLECERSETLLEHVLRDHGFRIDSGKSILYGECSACAGTDDKKSGTCEKSCSEGHCHEKNG